MRKKLTRAMKIKTGMKASGMSRYGRKRKWLDKLEDAAWGFQIPEPKPWK